MVDPPTGTEITVCSTKYDGSFHRRQPGWFLERQGPLVLIEHRAGVPIEFAARSWTPQRGAIGLYWTDRFYAVFRVMNGRDKALSWYCNISTPSRFEGRILSYVDLDIDILIDAERRYRILDEDEFEANSGRLEYPDDLIASARAAVAEILHLLEERAFPFDS